MDLFTSVIEIVCQVVTLASIIVKLTPTQSDDAFLAKVIKVLKVVSMNKEDIKSK